MRFRHATFFQQQRQHVACRRPQGLHKLTRNKLLYWDTGHGTITTSTYVCMYVCMLAQDPYSKCSPGYAQKVRVNNCIFSYFQFCLVKIRYQVIYKLFSCPCICRNIENLSILMFIISMETVVTIELGILYSSKF